MSYYWSRFVHVIKKVETSCLLHTVRVCCIYTNKRIVVDKSGEIQNDIITALGTDFLEVLLSYGYIVTNPIEDNALIDKMKIGLDNIKLNNLRLLVSNACNMNCRYCQIEKNIDKSDRINMSKEVAEKALKYFLVNCDQERQSTINITGGEPLLNYEVVRYIIKQTRALLQSCRIVMFTNATLVTEEIARYLNENDVFTIVSIDGPPNIHNENRNFSNGKPSYGRAIHGYNLLKQNNVKCGISAVLSGDWQSFEDSLEWICKLKPESVGMNYLHSLLGKNHNVNFKEHSEKIIYARAYLLRHGIQLENYERYRKHFILGNMKLKECQACGTGMTVDARGYVGTCKSLLVSDRIKYDLDTFDIHSNTMFREWAKRTPLNYEKCQDCVALSICGGGCAYDSYLLHDGEYWLCDERLCVHMQNLIEEFAWEKYKEVDLTQKEYFLLEAHDTEMISTGIDSVGH